jgi:hypothetical protein
MCFNWPGEEMKKLKNALISAAVVPVPDRAAVQIVLQARAVTVADAARYSGGSLWAVNEAVMNGGLPAHWLGNRRVIVVADLDEWINRLDLVKPSASASIIRRLRARYAHAHDSNPVGPTESS